MTRWTRRLAGMMAVGLGLAGCPAAQVGTITGPGTLEEPSPNPNPNPNPSPKPNPSPNPNPNPGDDGDAEAAEQRLPRPDVDPEIVQRIYFKAGSALLLAAALPILHDVAVVMRDHPGLQVVELQGHTDGRERGARLDVTRADNARRYLILQGVEPERLAAKGYGATHPLDPAATDAARARNRRVEFAVALRIDAP